MAAAMLIHKDEDSASIHSLTHLLLEKSHLLLLLLLLREEKIVFAVRSLHYLSLTLSLSLSLAQHFSNSSCTRTEERATSDKTVR